MQKKILALLTVLLLGTGIFFNSMASWKAKVSPSAAIAGYRLKFTNKEKVEFAAISADKKMLDNAHSPTEALQKRMVELVMTYAKKQQRATPVGHYYYVYRNEKVTLIKDKSKKK